MCFGHPLAHIVPTYLLLPCHFNFQVCALVTPCPHIYCCHVTLVSRYVLWSPLAHILPTYCPHIAHILPAYCPHIAHILPTHCPRIAHTLPTYCPHIAHILPTYCPHIAHILPAYCPDIAHILPTHCPHIAHTLPAYCPHIAHILPTYSAALSPPCPHIYCCHVTLRLWCGFVWCLVSTRLHSTHPLHCYTARGKCRHEVAIYFLALVA